MAQQASKAVKIQFDKIEEYTAQQKVPAPEPGVFRAGLQQSQVQCQYTTSIKANGHFRAFTQECDY